MCNLQTYKILLLNKPKTNMFYPNYAEGHRVRIKLATFKQIVSYVTKRKKNTMCVFPFYFLSLKGWETRKPTSRTISTLSGNTNKTIQVSNLMHQ
jgi:hypothetical protein